MVAKSENSSGLGIQSAALEVRNKFNANKTFTEVYSYTLKTAEKTTAGNEDSFQINNTLTEDRISVQGKPHSISIEEC